MESRQNPPRGDEPAGTPRVRAPPSAGADGRGIVGAPCVFALALVALLALAPALRAQNVAGVAASVDDEAVLAHLEGLLVGRLVRRVADQPHDLASVLQQARGWPERRVVLVDTTRGALHVLDGDDETIVTRLLSDDSIVESPYAVAFVATELLGLSDQLMELEPGPGTRVIPAFRASGFSVAPAAELTHRLGSGVTFLRPSLTGALRLGLPASPNWIALGLRGAAFGGWSRRIGPDTLEISQSDLGLGLGLGRSMGRLSLLPSLWFGLSFSDITLQQARVHERDGWLGVGLQGRYRVLKSFAFLVGAEARWTFIATRIQVRGIEVIPASRVGLVLSVGLAWDNWS